MRNTLRINYDDDVMTIIDAANELLAVCGLEFVDDGLEHDGFCVYYLRRTEEPK